MEQKIKTKTFVQEFPGKIAEEEPKNNDGRSVCFWCGSNTVKKQGFTSTYDVCETCER